MKAASVTAGPSRGASEGAPDAVAFRAPIRAAVRAFAEEVGSEGPVTCVGGRTHWHLGGTIDPDAREVRAPAGVVTHEPAEMIVRAGAATTVAELEAALAMRAQMCPIDAAGGAGVGATLGGILATGRSGVRRLRYGPVRDLLLEARYITADGEVAVAGAPVVKNVTGFDLCRLLVGSYGTIGFLAEVVLRCRPRPEVSAWFRADDVDPFAVRARLYTPSSVLWDGVTTWVLLEGGPDDVIEERRAAAIPLLECPPPELPEGGRLSLNPALLVDDLTGRPAGSYMAEIGVGTVHTSWTPDPPSRPAADTPHTTIKRAFDPQGRLNPGRWFW